MLAQKWNEWLDSYRGTYYDYLFVTANDVEHKEQSIDYLVDFAQQNNIDVVSGSLGRNYEHFSEIDDIVFSTDIADRMDTPAFLIKKGVIEKVGRVDEYFPLEFVERDYFYRAELAGFKVAGAKMKLHYHPDESVTVGYNNERFQKAFDRYVQKWGGDALKEQFTYPFNDMSLDFTYCKV
jgi:GT2 family glycosyltransferase